MCAVPQNSSVGINNENRSEVCWVTETRNITRTYNRRFTVGIGLFGHWCFLFPLARILVKKKEKKTRKYNKEKSPELERIFQRLRTNEIAAICIIDFFFPNTSAHLSAINYWHCLHCTNKGWWETVKTVMGSKRPPCSINYAPGTCLITWSTRQGNKPWPDLLIIKMQSNLLRVCCRYWMWCGAVSHPHCFSRVKLLYHCSELCCT